MATKIQQTNIYIFLLALTIAVLILVNGGFALWQMNKIKGEFYIVANRDLPLVSKLYPLIDRQFEQTLLLEKIQRLEINNKTLLVTTLEEKFIRLGLAFDTNLAHLTNHMTPMLDTDEQGLYNEILLVQQILQRITKEHAEYQKQVLHLIESMKQNSKQETLSIFLLLTDEEKDLRRELISLRDRTQHFTQQSSHAVEKHEEWMIQGMAGFSLLVFLLGILLLMLMRQVMKAREKANSKIEYYATYDPLTQLLNRRMFFEQLNAAMQTVKRYQQPLSLCICDLDKFKGINDTMGHQTGDMILTFFSDTLKSEKRTEDVVGRFGGDEFVLFFPNTPAKDAELLLERIRSKVEQKSFSNASNPSFSITASFGIAEMNHTINDQDHFLEQADQALYIAKEKGRNQTYIYQVEPNITK